MGVTAIKRVINQSPLVGQIINLENPGKCGNSGNIAAHSTLEVDMWIPWCSDAENLGQDSITVRVGLGRLQRSWSIYQRADHDGDFVRLMDISEPGNLGDFHSGRRIGGLARVDGDRDMIIDLDGEVLLQEH